MAEEVKKNEADVAVEEKTEVKQEERGEEKTSAKEDGAREVEIPAKFKKLIEEIEAMSVLDLHELVKTLEKKFSVSAQAVAVAAAPGVSAGAGGDEEKSIFTVELKAAGDQKIQVIKAVKELLGLGLKEAKDMVDGAPSVLKEGVKKADAEEIKAKIEKAGGSVELK